MNMQTAMPAFVKYDPANNRYIVKGVQFWTTKAAAVKFAKEHGWPVKFVWSCERYIFGERGYFVGQGIGDGTWRTMRFDGSFVDCPRIDAGI